MTGFGVGASLQPPPAGLPFGGFVGQEMMMGQQGGLGGYIGEGLDVEMGVDGVEEWGEEEEQLLTGEGGVGGGNFGGGGGAVGAVGGSGSAVDGCSSGDGGGGGNEGVEGQKKHVLEDKEKGGANGGGRQMVIDSGLSTPPQPQFVVENDASDGPEREG